MSGAVRYEATAEGPRNDFGSAIFDPRATPQRETQEQAIRRLVNEVVDERFAELDEQRMRPVYRPTVRLCVELAAHEFEVEISDILGDDRHAAFVNPRHAAVWLATQITDQSAAQIGRVLGRNHTTILSSRDRAQELRRTEPMFKARTDRLTMLFKGVG